MIVVMKEDVAQNDIDYLVCRSTSLGLETHLSQNGKQTVIGLKGNIDRLDPWVLAGLRGVERVVATRRPFRLASRDFKPENTVIAENGFEIGGDRLTVIAGPCSVESREQLLAAAWAVKRAGACLLRGGAFKPRTSPYSFQGLAEEGLKLLAEARAETGLGVVTEVVSPEDVLLVSGYADIMQIGARNMQNYALLHAVGESGKPVLLKRGMTATIEELLMSAEYILSHGNHQVILCERGIRTFETSTRNTLDIEAVPVLDDLTHLPVIVDPSHAAGRANLVKPVSKAAVAAGADGLIVEVHPDPSSALSDGEQSLTPQQFEELMREVNVIAEVEGRAVCTLEESWT